jgi:RNA polymerase sigma-70 factor (ECF subfamily)
LTAFAIDETLSLAFLVLLERLTPMERAVFLLREVFDYEYSEISRILNQNQTNCRQILRRARKHVAEARPRFSASLAERHQLLQRFLEATSRGDMDALIDLLSSDVVLDSDGGGKALAVPNLIHGVDKVSRAILGSLQRLVPRDLVTRLAMVNGQPGIISYRRGQPYSVITLDVHLGHIRTIFVLTNPHKLAHLAPLPPAPCRSSRPAVRG